MVAERLAMAEQTVEQLKADLANPKKPDLVFNLPQDSQLGSRTFWRRLATKVGELPVSEAVVNEADRIADVLENGGAVREQTFINFKELIQIELQASREQTQDDELQARVA